MKKHLLWIAVAVLVVALSGCVATQTGSTGGTGQRTVTVSGNAEVRVVPDEVILTLGIETSHLQLAEAKRQNDERVAAVLDLASAHGVPPNLIQTDCIGIEPRYRDSYEQREFIGYFVRKTVEITLRNLDEFEPLLSDALEAGTNYVHGIQFRTTELRQHRAEARALAINAAKEKATALASELGQEIGDPIEIREVTDGWWSGYSTWWGNGYGMAQNVIQNAQGAAPTDGSLAPGQISVNAEVSVTFALR
jgi:uncharacterized protein YggE